MRKAVFLDRDGVINAPVVIDGKPYPPRTVDEFVLLPGVAPAVRELSRAGFLCIVVTNQPDVRRGTQSRAVVDAMHAAMTAALPIDEVKVCWDEHSDCYKPKPGMVLEAAQRWGIALDRSYLVGDRWRDVDCARASGVFSIFIDRGYDESLRSQPDVTVQDLPAAAGVILKRDTSWGGANAGTR